MENWGPLATTNVFDHVRRTFQSGKTEKMLCIEELGVQILSPNDHSFMTVKGTQTVIYSVNNIDCRNKWIFFNG